MTLIRMFHVLCDTCNRDHTEFKYYAQQAIETALKDGWVFKKNGLIICPDCKDKKNRK